MGPPTVSTVGDANDSAALPLARFTVTGPALSKGEGPVVPRRRFTCILRFQSGQ